MKGEVMFQSWPLKSLRTKSQQGRINTNQKNTNDIDHFHKTLETREQKNHFQFKIHT